jgi:hypothetical protein
MSLSPAVRDLIGGLALATGQAVADGLRAQNDADAIGVLRKALLRSAAEVESLEAKAKFPELRED